MSSSRERFNQLLELSMVTTTLDLNSVSREYPSEKEETRVAPTWGLGGITNGTCHLARAIRNCETSMVASLVAKLPILMESNIRGHQ